jgi:hypothetical protein
MTAPFNFNPSVTEQIPQPHRGPLLSERSTRRWSPMTSPPIVGSHHAARGR